jgi:hypothetical protein
MVFDWIIEEMMDSPETDSADLIDPCFYDTGSLRRVQTPTDSKSRREGFRPSIRSDVLRPQESDRRSIIICNDGR